MYFIKVLVMVIYLQTVYSEGTSDNEPHFNCKPNSTLQGQNKDGNYDIYIKIENTANKRAEGFKFHCKENLTECHIVKEKRSGILGHAIWWSGPALAVVIVLIMFMTCLPRCSPQNKALKEHVYMRVINVKHFKKMKMKVELGQDAVVVRVATRKNTLEDDSKQKMSVPIPYGIKQKNCFAAITSSGFLYIIMLKNMTRLEENPLTSPKSMDISIPQDVVHLAGFSQGRSKSMEVLSDEKPFGDVPNRGYFTLDLKRLNINMEMGVKDGEFPDPPTGSMLCLYHQGNDNQVKGYQHLSSPQYMSIDTPSSTMPRSTYGASGGPSGGEGSPMPSRHPSITPEEGQGAPALPLPPPLAPPVNSPQQQNSGIGNPGNHCDNSKLNQRKADDDDLNSFPPPPPVPLPPDPHDDLPPPPMMNNVTVSEPNKSSMPKLPPMPLPKQFSQPTQFLFPPKSVNYTDVRFNRSMSVPMSPLDERDTHRSMSVPMSPLDERDTHYRSNPSIHFPPPPIQTPLLQTLHPIPLPPSQQYSQGPPSSHSSGSHTLPRCPRSDPLPPVPESAYMPRDHGPPMADFSNRPLPPPPLPSMNSSRMSMFQTTSPPQSPSSLKRQYTFN